MATTSSTKKDNQNVTRTKSIGRKPKQPSSVSSDDGSDQKPEKPLPNYLKPTISSRPDPVKFLKKNLEDNQKLLRRRSFDRPPSSLTSPSTSSPRIQKTLNVSPSRPRDRPAVPREKPATALRSSSFHGSRGVPRGGSTIVKSSPVAPKKSGLSSSSTSLKSKKEGPAKKAPEKEITLDTVSLSSVQEDHEEEILKVESDVHVADDIEQPKDEKENDEVHVEVVHADESCKEDESGEPTLVTSPVGEEDIVNVVAKEEEEEEEERLINEDNSEEKIEEKKEQENIQENKGELVEEVNKKIDEDETSEKVDTDMSSKEVGSVQETTEEKQEEVKEEKEVSKEEMEVVKEDDNEKVKEEKSGDGKKREVVKGKTECSSAYNDVIASKMQENPRKNKVLALAGAFQTVIDYETAASK